MSPSVLPTLSLATPTVLGETQSNSANLVARWEDAIERTVAAQHPDDDVDFAVGPSLVPMGGGMAVVMLLAVSVPAADLGQRIQASAGMDLATPLDGVAKAAHDLVEQALGQRSKMLADTLSRGEPIAGI